MIFKTTPRPSRSETEKTTEPFHERPAGTAHATPAHGPSKKVIAQWLETAEHEEQKRHRQARIHNGIGITMMVSFVVIITMIISIYLKGMPTRFMDAWIPFLGVVNSIVRMGFRRWGFKPDRMERAVASLSMFPHEPRRLLPLIDGLHLPQTTEWKNKLYPALTDRLWNLSPTDATLSLDDTRRATLRDTLSNAYAIMPSGKRKVRWSGHFDDATTDLAIAIMKTLAGIGDQKSVKVLQRIIGAEATAPNENVVRDAAREYLLVLTQKMTENNHQWHELRAKASEQVQSPFSLIRVPSPYTVIEDYVGTLPADKAKAAPVDFLHTEHRRGTPVHSATATTITVGAAFIIAFVIRPLNDAFIVGFLLAFGGIIINLLALPALWQGYGPEACKVAYELAKRSEDDIRLLPVLFQAAQNRLDEKQGDAVKKALVRLLPLLQPGDAALVSPKNRRYLRSWLKTTRSQKKAGGGSQTLTIVALEALAVIGDTKALPAAERLARRTRDATHRETELHEAALRCVEALRGRHG